METKLNPNQFLTWESICTFNFVKSGDNHLIGEFVYCRHYVYESRLTTYEVLECLEGPDKGRIHYYTDFQQVEQANIYHKTIELYFQYAQVAR